MPSVIYDLDCGTPGNPSHRLKAGLKTVLKTRRNSHENRVKWGEMKPPITPLGFARPKAGPRLKCVRRDYLAAPFLQAAVSYPITSPHRSQDDPS
jgi:hypothetical protein